MMLVLFMLFVAAPDAFPLGAVALGEDDAESFIQVALSTDTLRKAQSEVESEDVTAGVDDLPSFEDFNAKHGRVYPHGSEEYTLRLALFEKRVEEVRRHNRLPDQSWWAGVNHLSDRTEEELKALRGWKGFAGGSAGQAESHAVLLDQEKQVVVPNEKSWGHLKTMQDTLDQSACGSCWAMATTNMMNSAWEIAGGNQTFAAQDIVNCAPNPHHCGGTGGCDGSTVELAMNWIASNGLRFLSESPYLASDRKCEANVKSTILLNSDAPHNIPASPAEDADLHAMTRIGKHQVPAGSPGHQLGLHSWTRLPENEYLPLMVALQQGPIAVSLDATGWAMYSGGIFDKCKVDAVIDHAVVAFGYGYDDAKGLHYWHIKNSWGKGWGTDGNMRLLRESSAEKVECGWDRQPEVGTGCDGGPKKVKVCGKCGILYDVVSVHIPPLSGA